MPLTNDIWRAIYIINEVNSSQLHTSNLPISGILPRISKAGEIYIRRVNKGIKIKFARGEIKDTKLKL